LSRDGRLVAFTETGAGAGSAAAAFVRRTDGSPAIRIAEGRSVALSPDAKLLLVRGPGTSLQVVPVGAGSPRALSTMGLADVGTFATWTPDGSRIILPASEPDRQRRMFAL